MRNCEVMDVPDIARHLKSANNALQIQAVVALCQKIQKENSAVVFRKLLELVFEAAQSNCAVVAETACSWIHSAIIGISDDEDNFSVANKDHFKNLDATFTEILSRIKKAKHPKFLIRVVLAAVDLQDSTISENPDASTSFHQIFLHLLSVVSTNILEEIVLESNQSLSRILRLIHSKKLPADLNHVFMDQFCKLEGSEEWIHGFQMLRSKIPIQNWQDLQGKTIWCDFLLERLNSLPMNSKIVDQQPAESKFKVAEMLLTCSRSDIQKLFAFGFIHPDPVFLIPLFSVINSGNQIVRVLKDSLFSLDSNVSDQLSAVFKECQSLQNQVVSSETKDDVWNLQKWFEWLSKDENLVVLLLEKWKTWFKAEKKPTLQNLIVLFAIFNNLDKQRHLNLFFEVLNQFCVEEFETQVLNFHLCHFASSKDLELKNALLLNLPNLKVNDISKQQILRFLYACSETDVWEAAYIATAKLFEKNDWLFNELEFQSMILVPKEHSDSNLVDHKFNLLKLAALTESGEKLIAKVVQFVKTRPDFLVHCVETITNLSKNEMVEIPMLRSLLLPKIRQNEAALAAYCEFLATSVIDAEEFELATECAVELWQLRIHKSEKVRSAAFKALASFSRHHLLETLAGEQENPASEPQFLSGEQVFLSIDDSSTGCVLDGFHHFLRKCLEIDVEMLPRKFFVAAEKSQTSTDASLFVALIPVFRETLQSPGFEWQALALMEPLTRSLTPAGKKSARCERILAAALETRADDLNPDEWLKRITILKNSTEILFSNMFETNLAMNKNLGIIDVLKTFSTMLSKIDSTNLLRMICLVFAWRTAEEMLLEEAHRDLSKQAFLLDHLETLQNWKKRILDTILPIIDPEFSPAETPILQISKVETIDTILACFSVRFLLNQTTLKLSEKELNISDYCRSFWNSAKNIDEKTMDLILKFEPIFDDNFYNSKFKEVDLRFYCQLKCMDFESANLLIEQNSKTTTDDSTILKDLNDVKKIWEHFLNLSEENQAKTWQLVAKKTEKVVKSDKTKSAECADYLAAYCCLFSFTTKKRRILPENYSNLSDRSVLRHAFKVLTETKNLDLKKTVVGCLVGLKRKEADGSVFKLPAVDWKKTGLQNLKELEMEMFLIGLEQADLKLIHEFLWRRCLKKEQILEVEQVVSKAMEELAETLPLKPFENLLDYLVELLTDEKVEGEHFVKVLQELAKKRFNVREILSKKMAKFDKELISSKIFEQFCGIPSIFDGFSGSEMDFWKELSKKERIEIGNLIQKYSKSLNLGLFVSWIRCHVSDEAKIKLIKRLAQIQISEKAPANVLFDLLVGLMSASTNAVIFPAEFGSSEDRQALIQSFPGKLPQLNATIEDVSKVLTSILAAENDLKLVSNRELAKEALRICVNCYPACLDKIGHGLLAEILN